MYFVTSNQASVLSIHPQIQIGPILKTCQKVLISYKYYLDDLDNKHKRQGQREDDEDQGEHGEGHGAHPRTLLTAWKCKYYYCIRNAWM